ncbi:MAG TPA: hypothetical protein VKA92_13690, partial [Segetibacter sp.]|nr:hypothetical protein [Segetibacter sp.]
MNDKVSNSDIENLAEKIADFHKNAAIISQKDFLDVQSKFNDLSLETDFLKEALDRSSSTIISRA